MGSSSPVDTFATRLSAQPLSRIPPQWHLLWYVFSFACVRQAGCVAGMGCEDVEHAPEAFVPAVDVAEVVVKRYEAQRHLQRPKLGAFRHKFEIGVVMPKDGFFVHHRREIPLDRAAADVFEVDP